jgi:hypothetical protein
MTREIKTKPTGVSVTSYLDAIDNEERRRDCDQLVAMMKRVTGCEPRMWGPSIVGFDTYHYRYDSGHEGDMCVAAFSSRRPDISVYLSCDFEAREALLAKLGRHKMGKSCLYIRRLSDVDLDVLERLVVESVADCKQRYG